MFERYTERARRVIFFARYEASVYGSTSIETEHLLMGLFRENKNIANKFLHDPGAHELIRKEIEARITVREKVSTSIDLPLTDEGKRILAFAAEEAESLNHRYIGTEHLLLGILREDKCMAAQILRGHGLEISALRDGLAGGTVDRDELVRSTFDRSPTTGDLPQAGCVPDEDTAIRIAEAVLTPIHGREAVEGQRPFKAGLHRLDDGEYWAVTGHTDANQPAIPLQAWIRRDNSRILTLTKKPSG
jgi:hypothetical protein